MKISYIEKNQGHGESFKAWPTQDTSDYIKISYVHILLSSRLINGCVLSMGEVLFLFLYLQILTQSPEH